MPKFFTVLCFILALGQGHVCLAENDLVVADFSALPQAGALPESWEPLLFKGVDRHTSYEHIIEDGHGVIQAISEQSSSGLVRKIKIDLARYPRVSFHWKIEDRIDGADLTRKNGDDAPARLYITFAYDADQVGMWEALKFETIKLFYGEYPPIAALTYVWAGSTPKGTVLTSPYTERVKVIVLESGGAYKGQWRREERNIADDYRAAFGTNTLPMISGVAIMTDTDNTGGRAVAWYGDIIFHN